MSLKEKNYIVGATGLAQCAELTWQLRGTADKRQVPGAKLALQHNIGLGNKILNFSYIRYILANKKKRLYSIFSSKVSSYHLKGCTYPYYKPL